MKDKRLKKINLDFKKIKKLTKFHNIFYLINSKNLVIEKKIFFHFKKLLKKVENKPKIILSSSGSVYGLNSSKYKFNEKNKISKLKILKFTNYKKKYSLQKIFLENEFIKLGKNNNNVSIARCFSFYGKNILKYKYIISDIINSTINKKDIIFKDKSKVFRGYMHESDLAKWLFKICENANPKCPIYNVGSNKVIDLKVFAKKIANFHNINVSFLSNKKGNDDFYVPDISLVKNNLKLKIERNLQTDIKFLNFK